jgi:soluble lytic murein transglycosylase
MTPPTPSITTRAAILVGLFVVLAAASPLRGQLAPTAHPPLPATTSEYWLVPDEASAKRSVATYQPLTEGVRLFDEAQYERALTFFSRPALAGSALADYAARYKGLALLRLSRHSEARETFAAIKARNPSGYLSIAAALGEAEASEALGDWPRALANYEKLAADKNAVTPQILSKMAGAARGAGDRRKTADALLRIYYEHALSDEAVAAAADLAPLRDIIVRESYKADLGRALQLYGARRYSDARAAFGAIQEEVSGDDRELVELRIAESDYFLQRYPAALEGVKPWLDRGARQAEARFFHLSALRELHREAEYLEHTRALVRDFPDSSWAVEALNNLGTFHILESDDGEAAGAFRELFEKFPAGPRSERAAWKAGWWSYKNEDYQDTVRVFERAAETFPRSDYRPSFLYWSARAHGKLGAGSQAESRLRLLVVDYGNSYYGRLALRNLPRQGRAEPNADAVPAARAATPDPPREPPTSTVIRLLLASELYDDALNELRFAERAWGTSRPIEATIAWTYYQKGELRRAITLMRRAYPQFLTADQTVPREILQVIFPLKYWDLIRKHAAVHDLDPYLIAALVAQESNFDPEIRSAANAWGLMQIVPATGRRLARSVGIRRFTTSMLTNPETNVRLGTLYFSQLSARFGGTYYALASYNAGESRVVRWKAERPGLEEDEFIDDIPFPETQNYVKRILGTAEDYRRLYGKK